MNCTVYNLGKRLAWLSVFAVTLLGGCTKAVPLGSSFQKSEHLFFDDGIDVLSDYEALTEQFRFEAREDIDARSNLSDVVALVSVVSVQTNQMAEGAEERRIEVKIDRLLYGSLAEPVFHLRSASNSLGYTLLDRHEVALEGSLLLFLRSFSPDENGVGHHFHLSPNTPSVLKQVSPLLKKRLNAEEEQDD